MYLVLLSFLLILLFSYWLHVLKVRINHFFVLSYHEWRFPMECLFIKVCFSINSFLKLNRYHREDRISAFLILRDKSDGSFFFQANRKGRCLTRQPDWSIKISTTLVFHGLPRSQLRGRWFDGRKKVAHMSGRIVFFRNTLARVIVFVFPRLNLS